MKIKSLVVLSLVLSIFTINAATAVKSETVKVAETNLNSVMVDILSGVRDAGKELYGVSKDAIRSSVNFAQEQAPLVVNEFLRWHIARSIGYALAWLTAALVLLYVARLFAKVAKSDGAEAAIIPCWLLRLGAVAMLIFGMGAELMTVTKIAIAPKVYIIEYVVDTIKDSTRR